MKVLFLSNHEVTLYYFRTELIRRLIGEGREVAVSQPYGEYKDYFESLGCVCFDSDVTQYGMNPLKELYLVKSYKKLLKEYAPDVVLTYTIKPNLYGGMACASLGIPYISTVTGLGGAFEKGALFKTMTVALYRRATRKISAMFFQNDVASNLFDGYRIAKGKHVIVPGSGVNLEKHTFSDYPPDDGTTKLLFIGRVMNDKGVRELFDGIRKLKDGGVTVSLDVVGWCEDECRELLDRAVSDGVVTYHGWQEDVRPYIKKCNAVILPSYHEGMANSLLEAEAAGRPVLASRIHGCVETFDEGVTGFSFEPRDTASLVNAVRSFSELPYDVKMAAGRAAREKTEREFDRCKVVDEYIKAINEFGGGK
ncbi:MAG: glycosyltransferase family 4 protein [Clostridia bacterium]|nr:glycosyltransferase family 4 protein [Clostridia bacterium]